MSVARKVRRFARIFGGSMRGYTSKISTSFVVRFSQCSCKSKATCICTLVMATILSPPSPPRRVRFDLGSMMETIEARVRSEVKAEFEAEQAARREAKREAKRKAKLKAEQEAALEAERQEVAAIDAREDQKMLDDRRFFETLLCRAWQWRRGTWGHRIRRWLFKETLERDPWFDVTSNVEEDAFDDDGVNVV